MLGQTRTSKYWLSVLLVAVSVSAVSAAKAQNAYIVPRPPVHPQSVSAADANSRPFQLTVINMSGQRRQIVRGKEALDLPIGRDVQVECRPGDVLRVVSDTDSRVSERISATRADAARVVDIR